MDYIQLGAFHNLNAYFGKVATWELLITETSLAGQEAPRLFVHDIRDSYSELYIHHFDAGQEAWHWLLSVADSTERTLQKLTRAGDCLSYEDDLFYRRSTVSVRMDAIRFLTASERVELSNHFSEE